MANATRTRTQLLVFVCAKAKAQANVWGFLNICPQRIAKEQLSELGKSKSRQLTKLPKKCNSHHL